MKLGGKISTSSRYMIDICGTDPLWLLTSWLFALLASSQVPYELLALVLRGRDNNKIITFIIGFNKKLSGTGEN